MVAKFRIPKRKGHVCYAVKHWPDGGVQFFYRKAEREKPGQCGENVDVGAVRPGRKRGVVATELRARQGTLDL